MFTGLRSPFLRSVLTLSSLVIIIGGMKLASPLLEPIVFSVFIAIICAPALHWLMRKGVPAWLAIIILSLILLLGMGVLSLFIYISLLSLDEKLPAYEARFIYLQNELADWLKQMGLNINSLIPKGAVNPAALLGTITSFLQATIQSLTSTVLIILGIIFALLEARYFSRKLRIGAGSTDAAIFVVTEQFNRAAQQFIYLKAVNNLIVAVGATVFLGLFRIDFFLLWGVLIFFLSYIPNVGIVLACIPAIILALLQHGLVTALIVTVGITIINLIGDNVITPQIMGPGLDLSQCVVFFSFIFWTWTFGVVGALLSVPLTVLVKLILEANEETRWLAVLMSSNKSLQHVDKQTRTT